MKCGIHVFLVTLFASAMSGAFPVEAAAGSVSPASSAVTIAKSEKSALPVMIATVNGTSITQADLDNAVAASGARDTAVLRRTLKHRLIALELLKQAAVKERYVAATLTARQGTDAERVTKEAIRLYLNDKLRPPPVTDSDVLARYDKLVATRIAAAQGKEASIRNAGFLENGVQSAGIFAPAQGESRWMNAAHMSGFASMRDGIRQQLEKERLDEAIRVLVDTLMEQASITD